jgi:hypothetical protein
MSAAFTADESTSGRQQGVSTQPELLTLYSDRWQELRICMCAQCERFIEAEVEWPGAAKEC